MIWSIRQLLFTSLVPLGNIFSYFSHFIGDHALDQKDSRRRTRKQLNFDVKTSHDRSGGKRSVPSKFKLISTVNFVAFVFPESTPSPSARLHYVAEVRLHYGAEAR